MNFHTIGELSAKAKLSPTVVKTALKGVSPALSVGKDGRYKLYTEQALLEALKGRYSDVLMAIEILEEAELIEIEASQGDESDNI